MIGMLYCIRKQTAELDRTSETKGDYGNKKIAAMIMVLLMTLALCAAAFAESYAYLEWNEELQRYEITIYYDDENENWTINPNPYQPVEVLEEGFLPPFRG